MRPFDWLPLTLGLKISGHGSFDQQELDLYRASWAREDAFTHMFFWTIRKGTAPPELGPISTPVLIVALPDDPGIPVGPARQSARHCSNLLLVELPHVGHWVQREAPERTNELIIEFVRSLERG
jgi:pimeloyl-ACP methyl ester carboxylesterase